jgi:hypothetical protein
MYYELIVYNKTIHCLYLLFISFEKYFSRKEEINFVAPLVYQYALARFFFVNANYADVDCRVRIIYGKHDVHLLISIDKNHKTNIK